MAKKKLNDQTMYDIWLDSVKKKLDDCKNRYMPCARGFLDNKTGKRIHLEFQGEDFVNDLGYAFVKLGPNEYTFYNAMNDRVFTATFGYRDKVRNIFDALRKNPEDFRRLSIESIIVMNYKERNELLDAVGTGIDNELRTLQADNNSKTKDFRKLYELQKYVSDTLYKVDMMKAAHSSAAVAQSKYTLWIRQGTLRMETNLHQDPLDDRYDRADKRIN